MQHEASDLAWLVRALAESWLCRSVHPDINAPLLGFLGAEVRDPDTRDPRACALPRAPTFKKPSRQKPRPSSVQVVASLRASATGDDEGIGTTSEQYVPFVQLVQLTMLAQVELHPRPAPVRRRVAARCASSSLSRRPRRLKSKGCGGTLGPVEAEAVDPEPTAGCVAGTGCGIAIIIVGVEILACSPCTFSARNCTLSVIMRTWLRVSSCSSCTCDSRMFFTFETWLWSSRHLNIYMRTYMCLYVYTN